MIAAVLAIFLVLHTPPHTHSCHLYLSDWWSEALTVEYAVTHPDGATILATTSNGCLCLVFVPQALLQQESIILAGREFIGAGWLEDGEIVLQKVCLTFEGCVATRNEGAS